MRLAARYMIALVTAAGCTVVSAAPRVDSHQQQAHGLAVGDRFAQRPLDCGAAGGRLFADTQNVQLVTFATETDCSLCHAHLAGLDELVADDSIRVVEFIYLWAPKRERSRDAIYLRRRTARLVCIDTSDAPWGGRAIEHTPVTALIDRGRIGYLHDYPLSSPASRHQLLRDLRTLSPRRRQ